ncbi:hypothetical protein IF1G_00374 [Cordyceps javanica]|uniref:Uncharacterized protein n=1 Tax=Cordyceps javanica TaxID=43265 RepID=A0A545VFC8_9HYPO|nr:hypothetical protein IF1G_00374 [Cordyceps javanica]
MEAGARPTLTYLNACSRVQTALDVARHPPTVRAAIEGKLGDWQTGYLQGTWPLSCMYSSWRREPTPHPPNCPLLPEHSGTVIGSLPLTLVQGKAYLTCNYQYGRYGATNKKGANSFAPPPPPNDGITSSS